MRALFTCLPGYGHFHPLVPIARRLEADGHEVAFACSASFRPTVEAAGFRTLQAGLDWLAADIPATFPVPTSLDAHQRRDWVTCNVFAGTVAERAVPDLIAIGRDWRPHVLVRDSVDYGGCVAAEVLDIPHASVQVLLTSPHRPDLLREPLNALRRAHGIPPDPDLAMLHRYLNITFAPPSLAGSTGPSSPTTVAIRPEPERGGVPEWAEHLPERPTVYVSLGTVVNRRPGVFTTLIAGLRDEDINLILTIGPNQGPDDFSPQPPNVRIERYIDQAALLPRCDLFVNHGGSGAITGALLAGVPMVIVPLAADQPDNARRCASLGVAEVVEPARLSPDTIRVAARTVLRDATYRHRAQQLGGEMRALPDVGRAVELITRIVKDRQPFSAAC